MPVPRRGEIWWVDLGLVAKTRPCLLLTDYPQGDELMLVTVVPHTTALRNTRWELAIPKPFLKPGAFHLQQILSIPVVRLEHRIGALADEEMLQVGTRLRERLHLS
jgi:mRNA interferase MazF